MQPISPNPQVHNNNSSVSCSCHLTVSLGRLITAHSIAVLSVAPIFWVWALIHCIRGSFDLGVVSFLVGKHPFIAVPQTEPQLWCQRLWLP